MCKFNSRLFVFLVVTSVLLLTTIRARPTQRRSIMDLLSFGNDYDLKYDQRQKGTENFRVKLDGFFIGVPTEVSGYILSGGEIFDVLGEELLLNRDNQGQPGDLKSSDLLQKQIDNYTRSELEKVEEEEPLLSPKIIAEGRGEPTRGSRTRVYIMNLLDYIRKNRRH